MAPTSTAPWAKHRFISIVSNNRRDWEPLTSIDAKGLARDARRRLEFGAYATRRALKMDRAAEITLLKTLLHYIDTKTTAMAEAPWHNEVTAYTCPERHKREEEILIRKRPLRDGAFLRLAHARRLSHRRFRRRTDPDGARQRWKTAGLPQCLPSPRRQGCPGRGECGSLQLPLSRLDLRHRRAAARLPEEATSFPGVRAERPGLTPLPLAEKYGMVWVLPTPAADRSASLDYRSVARRIGCRSCVLEARHLPLPRSPRAARGNELEAARRYLP